MKQVLSDTLKELRKNYTNFSIIMIAIAAFTSFFSKIQVIESDPSVNILKMVYFVASFIGLMTIAIRFFGCLEDYLESTRLAKFSIASLFFKQANHALVNVKTLIIVIALIYVVVAIVTGDVFASAISFWFISAVAIVVN